MRKIEEEMLEAIRKQRNFKRGNTRVRTGRNFSNVYLHGNHIAIITATTKKFNMCGWNSVTTRSRLNALGANVCQRKFTPYHNGEAIDSAKWYKF